MLNRSLLVDGVNEIFVVTTRISLVTFLLTIYCAKEFFSEINKEYFLKGTLTGFLAITIPGWTFIYALKNGVKWIDTTISGMGRGPGNTKTE